MGTYKISTCRDRRKKARGMDREEESCIKIAVNQDGIQRSLYLSEMRKEPIDNLSCEVHQEQ